MPSTIFLNLGEIFILHSLYVIAYRRLISYYWLQSASCLISFIHLFNFPFSFSPSQIHTCTSTPITESIHSHSSFSISILSSSFFIYQNFALHWKNFLNFWIFFALKAHFWKSSKFFELFLRIKLFIWEKKRLIFAKHTWVIWNQLSF